MAIVALYQDTYQNSFLKGPIGPLEVTYSVDWLDGVKRVSPGSCPHLVKIKDFRRSDFQKAPIEDMLFHLVNAVDQDAEACQIIGKKLGWTPEGEGYACQIKFTAWLKEQEVEKWEELDLSRLKLKTIPPQISLFTGLKFLDLRGNSLISLPPEIENLSLATVLTDLHPSQPEQKGNDFYCQPPPKDTAF